MKSPKHIGLRALLVLAAAASVSLSLVEAQVAPAPSTTASTPSGASSTAIILNPFEVTAAQDTSFTTSSVGSGSRLSLDLADVAAAYSVINRQLIDALGITDVQEAATWAPGQTFNFDATTGNGERFGQQGTFVSRGFQTSPGGSNVTISGNTGNQINFYQSGSSSSDAFAVETFDFGRGPNSSLFGVSNNQSFGANGGAGLSGVASAQTKRARFDSSTTSISTEIGSWGYRRMTLDYNRPLSETLGLRINLVDSDQPGYQRMKYSRTRGLNLTANWKPSNTTNVSITASNTTSKTKNPGLDLNDNFSGWDGLTVFRGPILNAMLSTNATPGSITPVTHPVYGTIAVLSGPDPVTKANFAGLTFSGEPQGINRRNGNVFTLDTTTRSIMDFEGFALTRRADSTSRVPVWTQTAPNGAYFARAPITPFGTDTAPAYWGNGNQQYITATRALGGMPRDMYDRVLERLQRPFLPGQRDNFANWVPNTIQWFKDAQFAVDQRITPHLFVSIGGDINRTHALTRNDDQLLRNGMFVDVNLLRPDGSPNPHYLDLFTYADASQGGLKYQDQWTDDQALRGNAAYTLDLSRWGNYTFNLNVNANTRNFQANTHSYVVNIPTIDIRQQVSRALLTNSTYWSDTARTNPADIVHGTFPFTELTYDSAGIPTVTTTNVRPTSILRGTQDEATTVYLTQYATFQTQAKFLQNRIALTVTGKRQMDKSYRRTGVAQGDLPGPVTFTDSVTGLKSVNPNGAIIWDGQSEVFKPTWAGSTTDYYTMTYQPLGTDGQPLKFTTGPKAGQVAPRRLATTRPRVVDTALANNFQIRNPLYQAGSPVGEQTFLDDFSAPVARKYSNTYSGGLVLRPVNGISPFINFSSQSIPPDIGALDMTYAVKKVVSAKEVAYGSSIDFGSKLHFRYNYYLDTRINNPASNNVVSNINALVNSRNVNDTIANSPNSLGFVTLPGNPDYTTTRNFGYEIEITAQPTPGLRFTLNGSAGSTGEDQATRYPLTKAWVKDSQNLDMMKQLLVDAGGAIDTSQRPTYNAGSSVVDYAPGLAVPAGGVTPTTAFALDQTVAINAYNNVWVEYDRIIDSLAVTRSRRTPSANFFADYTIQSGALKGLGIGAGLQWQGPTNAFNRGSETIIDPTNSARAIDNPLVNQQDIVWVTGARNTQANLSYSLRLKNGNPVRLALRINNPLNDRTVIYGYGLQQPNRDLSKPDRISMPLTVRRWTDPINFRFSATYTFSGSGAR